MNEVALKTILILVMVMMTVMIRTMMRVNKEKNLHSSPPTCPSVIKLIRPSFFTPMKDELTSSFYKTLKKCLYTSRPQLQQCSSTLMMSERRKVLLSFKQLMYQNESNFFMPSVCILVGGDGGILKEREREMENLIRLIFGIKGKR